MCPHSVITQVPGFREQLELFSTHGVVVSPHGAGLTNEMFLVPFSAVVGARRILLRTRVATFRHDMDCVPLLPCPSAAMFARS